MALRNPHFGPIRVYDCFVTFDDVESLENLGDSSLNGIKTVVRKYCSKSKNVHLWYTPNIILYQSYFKQPVLHYRTRHLTNKLLLQSPDSKRISSRYILHEIDVTSRQSAVQQWVSSISSQVVLASTTDSCLWWAAPESSGPRREQRCCRLRHTPRPPRRPTTDRLSVYSTLTLDTDMDTDVCILCWLERQDFRQ